MALGSIFSRLKEGLSRSTQKISGGITAVFKKRRLDDEALEELEDLLISADLGTEAARKVIAAFRRTRFGKEVTDEEIKQALAEEIGTILAPVARPLELDPMRKPHVVLVVGVNGTGKTTTIGKLAQSYQGTRQARGHGRGRYVSCRGGGATANLGRAHWNPGGRGREER